MSGHDTDSGICWICDDCWVAGGALADKTTHNNDAPHVCCFCGGIALPQKGTALFCSEGRPAPDGWIPQLSMSVHAPSGFTKGTRPGHAAQHYPWVSTIEKGTPMDCWQIIEAVLPHADRALLHGPPGTGKTFIAQHGVKKNLPVYSTYITEYTPVTEPRGTILPVVRDGERVFEWRDGPATMAYRNGGRLIINEIDKASDDCMTFFLALLDDRQVSRLTLPHGEIIEPHKDFTVVATMNARPNALLDALRDRFPITILVDKVNPKAVLSLSPDLREAALKTSMVKEEERRHGIRKWLAFDQLRTQVPLQTALEACFGADAREMVSTFKMAEAAAAGARPINTKAKAPGERVDELVMSR